MILDVHAAAAADLQAIRSLMERSTIYEAISAPTALCGGLAGVTTAAVLTVAAPAAPPWVFLAVWFTVFALISAFNLHLIHRGARRRREAFFSAGMKLTLRALAMPLGAGAVLGAVFAISQGRVALTAAMWVLFYGLALLATHGFAPRPLRRLAMVFTGIGIPLAGVVASGAVPAEVETLTANVIMGTTFGGLHLAYAAALALPLGARNLRRATASASESSPSSFAS